MDAEATAFEEAEVVVAEAGVTEDEALGNPKAPEAAVEGEEAAMDEFIGEASCAMAEAAPVDPTAAEAWRLVPEGFIELADEDEDFLEVFSLRREAEAEGWRVVEPLPP